MFGLVQQVGFSRASLTVSHIVQQVGILHVRLTFSLVFRLVSELKLLDGLLCDLDTACAVGDAEYLLKLLAYKLEKPPSSFTRIPDGGPVTTDALKKEFGKHYATFVKKVSTWCF